jgi:hypothetical protein
MPLISNTNYTDGHSGWSFTIIDKGVSGRPKFNPTKLNLRGLHKSCQYNECKAVIRSNRKSGLCDLHQSHAHDLLLKLRDPSNKQINIPSHIEIIDQLIKWAKTRNYDLTPLFSALSFAILGNIPDVSTLAGEIKHSNFNPPSIQTLLDETILVVDRFFPESNNSSYQPLSTTKGSIPARILAMTFAGLILCEEANRGDRWFWRQICKDEAKTEFLGGAMPIAYYAAVSFPWGLEIGKASSRLTPSP